MGRQPKKGLDYFPKDVNYYDDFKIINLLNEYGPLGQTVYDVILTMIYKQGYYLEIPSIEMFGLTVMRTIGSKWIKKEVATQVIYFCADIGLFDDVLLRQNIITSVAVQRRYEEVTARNKVDKSKYWLLAKNKNEQPLESVAEKIISATEKPISATEKPISATKMQQIKENEIKLNEIKVNYELIKDMFNETCVSFSRLTALSDKRKKAIKARIKSGYTIEDFKKLFEEAESSSFLKGKNNRDWQATFDWLIKDSNMAKVLDGNFRDKKAKPPDNSSYDLSEIQRRLDNDLYG